MKKRTRDSTFKQRSALLTRTYLLITSIVLTLTLSPAYTNAAYDPNNQESARVSDVAKKAATKKLSAAVSLDDANLALQAINEHADINAADYVGDIPLLKAAGFGHINTMLLLLEHKASANIKDKHGETALTYAVQSMWPYPAVIETLILHGANIKIANNNKKTPLHLADSEIRKIITDAAAKRATLEKELGLQNWDLETSSPYHIIEKFITPVLATIVCTYADPYHPSKQALHSAMRRCIYDRRITQVSKTAATSTKKCAIQ